MSVSRLRCVCVCKNIYFPITILNSICLSISISLHIHLPNNSMMRQIGDLQTRLEDLENKVNQMQQKDERITVREVMNILEDYIVLEIMQSKNQVIKTGLRHLSKIKKHTASQYSKYLRDKGLDTHDMNILAYLKDVGDGIVHDQRTPKTYEELRELISDDDDEPDDIRAKDRLCQLLQSYAPSPILLHSPFEPITKTTTKQQ